MQVGRQDRREPAQRLKLSGVLPLSLEGKLGKRRDTHGARTFQKDPVERWWRSMWGQPFWDLVGIARWNDWGASVGMPTWCSVFNTWTSSPQIWLPLTWLEFNCNFREWNFSLVLCIPARLAQNDITLLTANGTPSFPQGSSLGSFPPTASAPAPSFSSGRLEHLLLPRTPRPQPSVTGYLHAGPPDTSHWVRCWVLGERECSGIPLSPHTVPLN